MHTHTHTHVNSTARAPGSHEVKFWHSPIKVQQLKSLAWPALSLRTHTPARTHTHTHKHSGVLKGFSCRCYGYSEGIRWVLGKMSVKFQTLCGIKLSPLPELSNAGLFFSWAELRSVCGWGIAGIVVSLAAALHHLSHSFRFRFCLPLCCAYSCCYTNSYRLTLSLSPSVIWSIYSAWNVPQRFCAGATAD